MADGGGRRAEGGWWRRICVDGDARRLAAIAPSGIQSTKEEQTTDITLFRLLSVLASPEDGRAGRQAEKGLSLVLSPSAVRTNTRTHG